MYMLTLGTALSLLASIQLAGAANTPTIPQRPSRCTTTLITPTPTNLNCGIHGSLRDPALFLPPQRQNSFNACRKACLDQTGCISFGYGKSTAQCNLYRANLISQGIQDRNRRQGFVYYNRKCFQVTCPTDPTCTPEQSLNVVDNPSFEMYDDFNQEATGWTTAEVAHVDPDAEDAQDGTASMYMQVESFEDTATASQDLSALDPGSSYVLQYWFKPTAYEASETSPGPPNCTFAVALGDSTVTTHQFLTLDAFDADYTNHTVQVTPASSSEKLLFSWNCQSLIETNHKGLIDFASIQLDNIILSPCSSLISR